MTFLQFFVCSFATGSVELALMKAHMLHKVPLPLLVAISVVESSCYRTKVGVTEVHPWTVCVNGKDYFCKDKSSAIKKIKHAQSMGIKNIDVGVMQLNMRHHGMNFKSVDDMIDPVQNVAYAAKYLKKLYDETGSWSKAVALYHSKNPKHNIPYRNKVFKVLNNINSSYYSSGGKIVLSSTKTKKTPKKPSNNKKSI